MDPHSRGTNATFVSSITREWESERVRGTSSSRLDNATDFSWIAHEKERENARYRFNSLCHCKNAFKERNHVPRVIVERLSFPSKRYAKTCRFVQAVSPFSKPYKHIPTIYDFCFDRARWTHRRRSISRPFTWRRSIEKRKNSGRSNRFWRGDCFRINSSVIDAEIVVWVVEIVRKRFARVCRSCVELPWRDIGTEWDNFQRRVRARWKKKNNRSWKGTY